MTQNHSPPTPFYFPAWARNILAAAAVTVIAVDFIYLLPDLFLDSDLHYYEAIGRSLRYSEYPPLMTLIFKILAHLGSAFPFIWSWFFFYLLVVAGVIVYVYRCCPRTRVWHFPVVLLVYSLLFGVGISFARFDFLVLAVLYLVWQSFMHKRYGHSGAFLTAAAFIKVVPVVVWPLLWLYAPSKERRRVLISSLVTAVALSAIILIGMGPRGVRDNLSLMKFYHGTRTVQMESTWSAAHMLWQYGRGSSDLIAFHHGSTHNDSLKSFTGIIKLAAAAGLVAYLARAFLAAKRLNLRHVYFFRDMAVILLLALLLSPVLSPQFFMWVVPLVPLWLMQKPEVGCRQLRERDLLLVITVLLAVTTQLIYPHFYDQLTFQEPGPMMLQAARQVLLLAMMVAVYRMPELEIRNKASFAKSYGRPKENRK